MNLLRPSALLLTSAGLLFCQNRDFRPEPVDLATRQTFDKQQKAALVVGISAYQKGSGIPALHFAARDAEVLAETFHSQGYVVRLLKDSEATGPMIRRVLRELSDVFPPNQGTLVFFFAGHGYSNKGTNYLAPFELTADDLDGGGLRIQQIESLLQGSKARRKVMFVDACRNEPARADPQSRVLTLPTLSSIEASEGIRELYSTKAGRLSYEYEALRQGVFAYYLAKGLAGEASDGDGLVTFNNLTQYVTDNVRAYTLEKGEAVQVPFESTGPGETSGHFLLGTRRLNTTKPQGKAGAAGRSSLETNDIKQSFSTRLSIGSGDVEGTFRVSQLGFDWETVGGHYHSNGLIPWKDVRKWSCDGEISGFPLTLHHQTGVLTFRFRYDDLVSIVENFLKVHAGSKLASEGCKP